MIVGGGESAGRAWRRSSRCVAEAHCAEVSVDPDGVHWRSSLHPSVVQVMSHTDWACFVSHVREGDFDLARLSR
ncbi:DUF397 domain-containing protein [Phytohabitans suffuscus]|uniref:DUF397 domain-containing protein n=1 Tax=Phytohabitans suffuscus TaxID=624315 RepID=UPI0038CD518C